MARSFYEFPGGLIAPKHKSLSVPSKIISKWSGVAVSWCGRASLLAILTLLAGATLIKAQAGGHTLFGDIKVDEDQTDGPRPLFLQVLLYLEDGRLVGRQTVASNGRYRFLDLRNGRYEVAVEVENVEIARVRVVVTAPFRTDFRQDLEFQWIGKSATRKSGVISAADVYNRPTANAELFRQAAAEKNNRRFDRAIVMLRRIVDTDPRDFPAWTELGTIYFIQKNLAEAEASYAEALKLNADFLLALISLGRLRIVRKNFEGAIVVLTHAVEVEPASPQANYFLGEAYLQKRLGSKAVPYLNRAIKLDPVGMAEAHLRLAALYNARDLKDRAAAEYEAFLKQRPDYPDRKKLREYISLYKKSK